MQNAFTDPCFNRLEMLTDDELHLQTIHAAKTEQARTLVTIRHLQEVQRRRLYAQRGYSNIFNYTVGALGFSESAAAERVAALRLVTAVPEVGAKLEKGELSLTSAALVQRHIRNEEKFTESRLELAQKERLVEAASGHSVREVEKILLGHSKVPEKHLEKEKVRPVTPTRTELRLYAGAELMKDIERVRELKGDLSLEEIFTRALGAYLDKVDPIRQKGRTKVSAPAVEGARTVAGTPAAEPHTRYCRVADRRSLYISSGGQCEFVDEKSGRRCQSRFRLEIDHRIPFAKGGRTRRENLRLYCRAHNVLAAVSQFGETKMRAHMRG